MASYVSAVSNLAKPSAWALETTPSSFASSSKWSNKDMDPVPVGKCTWTTWNYIAYWISDATNAAVWELASSMLAIGLSWYEFFSQSGLFETVRQATGSACHSCRPCSHCSHHGFKRNNRCTPACILSCVKSVIVRILVQLFQCY